MRRSIFISMFVITAAASAAVVDALAGDPVIAGLARRTGVPTQSAPAKPRIPLQQLYLVRTTLASLADANRTGNYTVFRDTAAAAFQAKHSPADLAAIFADARKRPIDLAPALMLEPETFEATRPGGDVLQLAGSYISGGDRVAFKLVYTASGGHWRLADVALGAETIPAPR